jgi:hypothetical protein
MKLNSENITKNNKNNNCSDNVASRIIMRGELSCYLSTLFQLYWLYNVEWDGEYGHECIGKNMERGCRGLFEHIPAFV